MDLVIKKYFDQYRGKLPPEIEGEVEGNLMPDLELMDKWRNWRSGLEYHDEDVDAVLFGALDDCLVEDNSYIPLDYKTRGSAPKDGDSERYYQTQLDAYTLLLNANGYKTRNLAYLVYYYPEEVRANGLVKFYIKPVKVETDLERAHKTFRDAVSLLMGPVPERYSGCEYCYWISNRLGFE
ncbi:MAG: PD-(D/E)XK nuclease family protein [Candidatus Scalinduaceae bacterium]